MRLEKPDKEIPLEEQKNKILTMLISDRLHLYQDLKNILGEKDGVELFKKLYDEGMKRIRKNFPGGKLPIGDLMKRELISFPMIGFDLYIDHEVENGEDVYYEHITKCPFLETAQKIGFQEKPCDFICSYDVEVAIRDKRGRWEIKSRMGDGETECQFRIRDWKD